MRTVLIAILLAASAAAEQKRSADPHFLGGFSSYGFPLYSGFGNGFGFPSIYSYGYGYPFYTRPFGTIWKRSADASPSPVPHRISKRSADPVADPNPHTIWNSPYSYGLGYGGVGGFGRRFGIGYGGFGGNGGLYGFPSSSFTYVNRFPSYGYGYGW
ncbi:shematrin-like protein 1 [Palaemon carinicauda]|uniref:shematrin-like protein 1 n=1 Tax=Palaemon carinicauda TaxID=392227 RepID=UPI0035B5AD0B